jgi:transcriptional regulator with XRE-family HTH domain
MKERIMEFLQAENKTSAQLAEEIGVQPSGISHILSGRNNPSLDFILKMLEKYKFLSTDWLLFGRGQMYREAGMQSLFDAMAHDDDLAKSGSESVQGPGVSVPPPASPENSGKAVTGHNPAVQSGTRRIIVFYDDNSFEEYNPR